MDKVLEMGLTGGRNQRAMASLVHYPDCPEMLPLVISVDFSVDPWFAIVDGPLLPANHFLSVEPVIAVHDCRDRDK